jgi:hypothetical protein
MRNTLVHEGHRVGAHWSRRWRRLGLLSVIGLLAVLVPGTTSQAIPAGGFESADGDLAHGTATDWNDFEPLTNGTPVTPSGFDPLTNVPDRRGNPDDIFNGGVKQDKVCPGTKEGSLGGGDSKFDVARIYLTHTVVGGDDFLYLAWVRQPQNSTTASSHIAFEFNSGTVSCTNGNAQGAQLLERVVDDKLLVYDFEGGTADPTLKLLSWITDEADGPCEVASNSVPCWGGLVSLNGTNSDAKVNIAPPDGPGSVLDEIPNPDETLGIVEFGEAGINLTDIGVDPCAFAGHVTGVARSSGNSGTAQMKDKIGPAVFNLPRCVAETNITSNVSLDDHATINGFNSEGAGDGTGDLTFSLYGPDDTNCNEIVDATEDDPDEIEDEAVDPVYETTISDVTSGDNGEDPAAPWSTADGDNTESSYIVPTDAPGTYNWVVTYSGDTGNDPSASLCGDEQAVVTYGAVEE